MWDDGEAAGSLEPVARGWHSRPPGGNPSLARGRAAVHRQIFQTVVDPRLGMGTLGRGVVVTWPRGRRWHTRFNGPRAPPRLLCGLRECLGAVGPQPAGGAAGRPGGLPWVREPPDAAGAGRALLCVCVWGGLVCACARGWVSVVRSPDPGGGGHFSGKESPQVCGSSAIDTCTRWSDAGRGAPLDQTKTACWALSTQPSASLPVSPAQHPQDP